MTDGHRDNSVGERKLIWDEVIGLPLCLSEENRLLAVDDNGLAYARFRLRSVMSKRGLTLRSLARKVVSNYWYDADGERTVKTSGESDQVYVNGVFSGGSTNTAKFSLYVSPYLVANQGGRYTKHIYAGSQRIVSKVGDFASYGSDPRRIGYAGANTDGLSVDYKSKAQQQVIKDNYKFFDVPYNGTDNDNYADGEGFCCNDGSMEAAVAEARKAQARAVSRSFKDPDNYENLQFFYHPDHLGSSSFITNLEGEVVQHIEYVPFGEVFIEERNNVWNTPYLFNAKEFDEETGMYYYGARYYDPRLSLWMSTDPKEEKMPAVNSYCYVFNNPVVYLDPSGEFPWWYIIYRCTATGLEHTSNRKMKTIGYAMKHPYNAIKVGEYKNGSNNISTSATNFEINIANAAKLERGSEGTPGNAIRHTLWQAIITREFGPNQARHIGNVHEDNHNIDLNQRVFNDLSSADTAVDLLNNIIGRKIGKDNPNASNVELAKKVLQEYKTNGLWTVSKKDGKYHIGKTVITEKQFKLGIEEINKKNENGKNK